MKISEKNKKLYMFYFVFAVILLLAAFFVSEYIYLFLEQQEISAINFLPHKIVFSIMTHTNHLTIFVSMFLLIVFGFTYLLTSNTGNNYHSEMDNITDIIQTPKAVGQGQYGTSRWMKSSNIENYFNCYTLDENSNEIQKLLKAGEIEKKELMGNNEKQETIEDLF